MKIYVNLIIFIVAGDFDPTTRVEQLWYSRSDKKKETKKRIDEETE